MDDGGTREAVTDIHDFNVLDVIKKGSLGKKPEILPVFKSHFFVLQPHHLTFYSGPSEKGLRGEIILDSQCRVESLPDSMSKSPLKKTPGGKNRCRLQLFANEKVYEFQVADHRTRLQWLSAFRTAITHASEPVRYQRSCSEKRKIARQEEKEREDEEMMNQTDSLDQTKLTLEQEKQMRVHAEVQAATLQKQRAIDEKMMKEMEKIREQLEKLLEEER